jgi:putative nucleotidyltransferase with HDIG domain
VVGHVWNGEGWWLASDGKWYPPEQHPSVAPAREAQTPQVVEQPTPTRAPAIPGAATAPVRASGSLAASAPVSLASARPALVGDSIVVGNKETDDAAEDRWQGRPVLSALVSGSVFVVPISLSIVAATMTAHLLPRPHTTGGLAAWWVTVLAVPSIVLVVTDCLARRALPLAVLLKMTMVFPDQAPKRRAVVRKAGSTRNLAQRVEAARTQGINDEPVVAAEKILSLAGALNAHDRLTRGHGERVRVLTDLIAEELDLSTHDRDRLRWSALLHDIGKPAVHPHILNKPGKLDGDEWEIIKNHPLEGAKLTAPLASWLGEWGQTIVEHHEKFDGTGYPYGLKGDQISLGGRIVAVADCYDTMTTTRSYKASMSPKAARAELAACAGKQFDPRVVRAFRHRGVRNRTSRRHDVYLHSDHDQCRGHRPDRLQRRVPFRKHRLGPIGLLHGRRVIRWRRDGMSLRHEDCVLLDPLGRAEHPHDHARCREQCANDQTAPSVAVYTPAPALGISGTINSASEENF